MNAAGEASVREQLERAVSVIEPVAPPLDALRERARRRKRSRRAAGGFMVVAVAGVAVAIVAVVVAVAPSGNARLQVTAPPTHQSLVRYAKAHAGLKVAGPFGGGGRWYGGYTTKSAIAVVHYIGSGWRADGPAVTALGKGQFVTRLGLGPQLGSPTPTFAIRSMGGDVSYTGSVLQRVNDLWQAANFGACGHGKLCTTPSNSEPYGHLAGGNFVSVSNDCTPYCAAGTSYRITWRWSQPANEFVAQSEQPLKPSP